MSAGRFHGRTDLCAPDGTVLFEHEELACRATGVVVLAPGFAAKLIELRLDHGAPMTVTSCCRSSAHNRAVGGHPKSLHVYDDPAHATGGTAAIDIACDATGAWLLARRAMFLGWSVGRPRPGQNFIHLDRRADFKMPPALFGY